jgi:hypothetical protein
MSHRKHFECEASEIARVLGISESMVNKVTMLAIRKLANNRRYQRINQDHWYERRSNNIGSLARDEYGD